MVLGHYGLALGAKRFAPCASLGSLVFAAQLADLIWPILLLLGVERVNIIPGNPMTLRLAFASYPITHSLLAEVVGGLLLGALYFLARRDARGAIVTGLLVPSHWMLDLLVHMRDLPVWPGGPKVGLGGWRSLPLTLFLETCFFLGGLLTYQRATEARDRVGKYVLWGFIGVLIIGYASAIAGSPPKNIPALAYSALALWLFVPWAFWIDRHRINLVSETQRRQVPSAGFRQ
jgi:hypothetical protein